MPAVQTHTERTCTVANMTRHFKQLVQGLLLFLLLVHGSSSQGADPADNEYRIKTAFLYNFSSFVSWPEMAYQDKAEFQLCVVGNNPFGGALDTLSGKTVHGLPLKVRQLDSAANIHSCQLAYISKSETGNIAGTLKELAGKPVLTVSDIDDFALHGGIIRLKLVDNKVRFDINVDTATHAGLKISSRLLSLATIIQGEKVTAR